MIVHLRGTIRQCLNKIHVYLWACCALRERCDPQPPKFEIKTIKNIIFTSSTSVHLWGTYRQCLSEQTSGLPLSLLRTACEVWVPLCSRSVLDLCRTSTAWGRSRHRCLCRRPTPEVIWIKKIKVHAGNKLIIIARKLYMHHCKRVEDIQGGPERMQHLRSIISRKGGTEWKSFVHYCV